MRQFGQKQSGVGMIEVMVAILVLAVGVLGVVALQAMTLKNTGSSAERTQATVQIYSMMDIIRADRDNLGAYNTNVYSGADAGGASNPGTVNAWLQSLQETVSADAQGLIVCVADEMQCRVGVQWNDSRATGGAEVQQIEVSAQL